MRQIRTVLIMGASFIVLAHAEPEMTRANEFDLWWHTVDGGGVVQSVGGDFELKGTIGQPDAGVASGGDFTLYAGFWFPLLPADCNFNGRVDLIDYENFEGCLSGPHGGLVDPDCNCFDMDGDSDVDLVDFGSFQLSFNG